MNLASNNGKFSKKSKASENRLNVQHGLRVAYISIEFYIPQESKIILEIMGNHWFFGLRTFLPMLLGI